MDSVGKIVKNKININEIEIIKLKESDLEEYLDLILTVKNNMEHPEWLGDFSKEEYINILNNKGGIIGFKHNHNLIGAGVLIQSTKEELEKFLLSDLQLDDVINFGPQMVHPKYIGNKIQKLIIENLESISKVKNYKYALGTIHPNNIFSQKNLLESEFIRIGEFILKRGPRDLYLKEIIW